MPQKRSYSDNELENAIKNSVSWRQVITKLGLKPAGGNHTNIKATANRLGIDYSHFTGKLWSKGKTIEGAKETPYKDILVENSKYRSRRHLKKRLIRDGMLEVKCQIFGMSPVWNNIPLVLRIDHINGVNNDNRLENLRLICPNCDSQLPTYAGRNINKKLL